MSWEVKSGHEGKKYSVQYWKIGPNPHFWWFYGHLIKWACWNLLKIASNVDFSVPIHLLHSDITYNSALSHQIFWDRLMLSSLLLIPFFDIFIKSNKSTKATSTIRSTIRVFKIYTQHPAPGVSHETSMTWLTVSAVLTTVYQKVWQNPPGNPIALCFKLAINLTSCNKFEFVALHPSEIWQPWYANFGNPENQISFL